MKRRQLMCIAPANGGAIVARPGMNFAKISELTPQRSNRFWVWLTQESGSSDMRQRVLSTRIP